MLVSFLLGRIETENTTSEKHAEVHITLSHILSLSPAAIVTNPSCNAHEAQPLFFHRLPCDFSIILWIYPLILFFRQRCFAGLNSKGRKHADLADLNQGRVCLHLWSFFLVGNEKKTHRMPRYPQARGEKQSRNHDTYEGSLTSAAMKANVCMP